MSVLATFHLLGTEHQMDPGWSGLCLPHHVPVDFLGPPLSLLRQPGEATAKTSLSAGSVLTHRSTNMYREICALILNARKENAFFSKLDIYFTILDWMRQGRGSPFKTGSNLCMIIGCGFRANTGKVTFTVNFHIFC